MLFHDTVSWFKTLALLEDQLVSTEKTLVNNRIFTTPYMIHGTGMFAYIYGINLGIPYMDPMGYWWIFEPSTVTLVFRKSPVRINPQTSPEAWLSGGFPAHLQTLLVYEWGIWQDYRVLGIVFWIFLDVFLKFAYFTYP